MAELNADKAPVNEETCLKVVCDDDGKAVGIVQCKVSEVPHDYVDICLSKPHGSVVDLATLDRMICSDVVRPNDILSLPTCITSVWCGVVRFVRRVLCRG